MLVMMMMFITSETRSAPRRSVHWRSTSTSTSHASWIGSVGSLSKGDPSLYRPYDHDRMAVGFLDPLGRGGKMSNIPGGICCLLVVLVERADRQFVAVLSPMF